MLKIQSASRKCFAGGQCSIELITWPDKLSTAKLFNVIFHTRECANVSLACERLTIAIAQNLYPTRCKPRFTLLTQSKEGDTILRLTPRRKLAFPFKQIDLTAIQTSRRNRCFHEQFARIPDQSEE